MVLENPLLCTAVSISHTVFMSSPFVLFWPVTVLAKHVVRLGLTVGVTAMAADALSARKEHAARFGRCVPGVVGQPRTPICTNVAATDQPIREMLDEAQVSDSSARTWWISFVTPVIRDVYRLEATWETCRESWTCLFTTAIIPPITR